MMIIDELIEEAEPMLAHRTIADVRVGLGYTGVLLDDGTCGLAGTVTDGASRGCTALPEAGELLGRGAFEISQMALSANPVASCVGMATINAVLNQEGESGPDLMDVLPIDGAKVGMVGRFGPYAGALKERAKELFIFERKSDSEDVLPDWAAERILPDCHVVILTSLTLVNKTIDHLLDLAKGEVALLGPTTPMSSILAAHGVSHLFGTIVTNPKDTLAVISQAGGTHRFKKTTQKVYLNIS